MNHNLSVQYRIPILIAGFIGLACGIGGGLLRLGWHFSSPISELAAYHGPLMVNCFLGTVISLERAVAIGKRWAYLAPISAGLAGVSIITGLNTTLCVYLSVIAGIIFTIASFNIYQRQRAQFTFILLLGALLWLFGNLFWLLGFSIAQIIPFWISFAVLTIAGERLELSRFMQHSDASKVIFMMIVLMMLIGISVTTLTSDSNIRIFSAALLALGLWLLRHDIARYTIKQLGLTRFMAACMLLGYCWLLVAGVVGMVSPHLMSGSSYDAYLHAIFLGFIFSMIFGHAPIIFPALVKVKIPFHPTCYLHLFLLQISLILRLSGDFLYNHQLRVDGALLSVIAIALFLLSTIASVLYGRFKVNST